MPLEPGPLTFLSDTWTRLAPDPPEFGILYREQLAAYESADAELGPEILAAQAEAATDFGGLLDVDLTGAAEELGLQAESPADRGLDDAHLAAGEIDGEFPEVFNRAPEQIWQEVPERNIPTPAPPEPPPGPGGDLLIPPLGQFPPAPGPGTGFGAPPPGQAVILLNLTTPGAPSFRVGDHWRLTLRAAPGAQFTITANFNGVEIGPSPLGRAGDVGVLVLEDVMRAEHVGVWFEVIYANALPLAPALAFTVLP